MTECYGELTNLEGLIQSRAQDLKSDVQSSLYTATYSVQSLMGSGILLMAITPMLLMLITT